MNVVLVSGVIHRLPTTVVLPGLGEVVSLSLAVEPDPACAARHGAATVAVPVVVPDPSASVRRLTRGDVVSVLGHVRRRFFRAGGRVASPTEVVAESVVLVRHRAKVQRQVAEVAARLAEGAPG